MQNLNSWIEAQLKRGYSRKQIKSALIRKGYSPKAVAEVDKIRYSAESQNKKIPKNFPYKAFIGLMIFIVVLIWLFNALPFFSKQSSQNIAAGQKPAEQAANEVIPPLDQEKRLLETKTAEKAKEAAKEFNVDFCKSQILENIRNMPLSEYALNYHIDGSFGENVKWAASGQPPAEFSLFDSPKVFFVYSDGKFEGCGYKQEMEAKGIKTELRDKYGLPYLCKGKEVHITPKFHESYTSISLYQPESEDKAIALKISIKPEFGNKEQVLISMGCEI